MKTTPARAAKKPAAPRKKRKKTAKAKVSRERILGAARKVFSKRPYQAASMRMIGKEGGFEHPLIHYYFPTKADLFEAVLAEVCVELHQANLDWFEGLDGSDPRSQVPVYIDRIIRFNQDHPEAFKIIFLNMASLQTDGHIPGMQLIPQIISSTRETCQDRMVLSGSMEDHTLLNNVFCNMLICYLGADQCQGLVLGLEPESGEYRKWVSQALLHLFLPWVEEMMERGVSFVPPRPVA